MFENIEKCCDLAMANPKITLAVCLAITGLTVLVGLQGNGIIA